jgi:hypothetical protein
MGSRRDTPLKALKRRRSALCHDRNVWNLKIPNTLHFDFTIGCNQHAKPDSYCEGCCMKLYRADRIAEIASNIKTVDLEITAITGKPYGTAKPKPAKPAKPVQLALF